MLKFPVSQQPVAVVAPTKRKDEEEEVSSASEPSLIQYDDVTDHSFASSSESDQSDYDPTEGSF